MAKQLNVNLAFTADTSQALRNLQELKQNLSQIASIDVSNANISAELKTAASSAQALQTHLSNAFNIKTGNLDLSKLDASLKRSGASLSTLSNNLLGAGISGEKAFLQIQSSIASANTQLVKANGLVANFMTTLKNTARWQISSSILHGFMGAVQSAYGYAQDLNESLNNIRIVTGASTEEMSRFAAEANKTAKILSTTTTKYTNASLIYFQQGLNEEEVKQRTDITVKMANAAGASVEEVSNQLTAVWNNFAKSGEDLERYADIMTALGAATASSTDEIAGGLEKFAAVADTIGLSFEYAASALATITSNTRQSEEVVGTALKTIFARIQGLNLGETLDDGTTLNKYSEALQKVGISIFEQSGEIKTMDTILDEMASKWGTLAKDQQIALAQTVAGVRQYTQLVALMDNWNNGDSDSMMANLQTSADAEGSLQKQSDIYSESWEAASDRVRASLESIYKELVPDDMFIGLLKGLEKVLNMVEALVNAFGGLEGILMLVSSVVLTKFTANIGQGIQTGIDKVKNLSNTFKELGSYVKNTVSAAGQGIAGATQATFQSKQKNDNGTYKNTGGFEKLVQSAAQAQTSVRGVTAELERQQALSLSQASQTERTTKAFQSQVQTLKETTALTKTVKDNAKLFTEDTSKQLLNEIEQVRVLGEKKALLIEQSEILKEQNRNLMDDVAEDFYADSPQASGFTLQGDAAQGQVSDILKDNIKSLAQISGLSNGLVVGINKATGEMKLFNTETKQANDDFSNLESLVTTSVTQITQVSSVTSQLKDINLDDTFASAADKAAAMQEVLNKTTGISDSLRQKLQSAIDALKSGDAKQFNTILSRTGVEAKNIAKALGVSEDIIKKATQAGQKQASNIKQQTNAQNEYNNALNQTNQNIQTALANAAKIGPVIAQGLSQFQSVAMGISSVSNAITTLTDSSASFTSKLTATAMGLTMGFRAFMTVIQGVNSVLTAMNGTQAIANALAGAQVVLTGEMTAAKAKETIGTIAQQAAEQGLNATQVASMLTDKLGIGTKKAAALARLLVAGAAEAEAGALQGATAAQAADIVVTKAGTAANIAYAASQWLAYWPMLLIVAALAIIVGLIVAANKAEQARIENNKRMAEASKETAEALQEEADANEELVQSYNQALKTFKETGENKEQLVEAALKVASAYGLEGAAVDALAGNYDNLTKKIQQKRKAELKALQDSKTKAARDATKVFADTSDGTIYGNNYTSYFGSGWSRADENIAFDTLAQGDYKYITSNGYGGVDVSVNKDNPMEMYAYFQELEAWIQAQETLAEEKGFEISASEVYADAVAELEAGKEYYDELKAYMKDNSEIQAEMALYDTTFMSNGQRKDMSQIESLDEYIEFEKQFIEKYTTAMGLTPDSAGWEEAVEYAKTYLTTFEDLNKLQLEARGFESIAENDDYQAIKDYYDSLDDAQKEVFWTAGIDENTSIEEVKSYMDYAQSYIDAHGLYATIAIKDKAIAAFEQGNYEELKKMFEDENSPYDMEWLDFLQLGFEEKQKYLESAYINYDKILAENAQALADNAQAVNDAQNAYDKATTAVSTASKAWSTASQNVANHSTKMSDAQSTFGYSSTTDDSYYHDIINSGKYTGLDMSSYHKDDNGNIVFDEGGFNAYKFFQDVDLSEYLGANNEFATQWKTYMDYVTLHQTAWDNNNEELAGQYEQQFNQWLASSGFHQNMAAMAYGTGNYNGQYSQGELEQYLLQGLTNVFHMGDETNPMTESQQKDAAQYFIDALMFQMSQEHSGLEQTEEQKQGEYETAVGTAADKKGALTELEDTRQEQLLIEKSLTEARKEQDFFNNINELGLESEDVLELADSIQDAAENSEIFSKNLTTNEDAAREAAKQMSRYGKAVEAADGKFDDWKKALTGKDVVKAAETMSELRDIYADMLDLDGDMLSQDFLKSTENIDLMKDAMNGSVEAYNTLQTKAAQSILQEQFAGLSGITEEALNELTSFAAKAGDVFDFSLEDGGIGGKLANMYSDAVTAAYQGGASVAEAMEAANALMQAVGFEPPEVEMEEKVVTLTGDIPDGWTPQPDGSVTTTDADGNQTVVQGVRAIPTEGGEYTYTQTILVPKDGGKITKSTENLGGGKTGGNTGGGGGKPKKADTVKKTDVVDRYKEIDDKLDDIADKMDDASKAADRLWGPARLNQMKKVNEALEEEIDSLKKKRKEAQDNLDIDKQALKDTISAEAGVTITDADFDAEGNFTKYDEVLTDLYEEIDAAIEAANADGDADEDEQEKIDKIQERIDKVKEAIDQYDETRELIEDLDNDIQDKIYEWQDNNYEQLNYKLEYEIEINDSELELLDYYLGKTEGNIYSTAEAFAYMSSQADIYNDNLKHQEEYVKELERAYYAGEISMEAYKEGLRESQSAMIENLQALEEQKKAMQEYYGEVMDMALEEIHLYTDEMEELNSVLDHYSNILEIVGKQEDYATKGKVLQSKAANLRNEMQVQQELYEKSSAEAENYSAKMASVSKEAEEYQKAQQKYAAAQIAGDEAEMAKWAAIMAEYQDEANAYETYKNNWQAAQEAANEAQENMLAKTEEWAEAMKAVVENELAGLAKTMEESLTGGTSFDELLTSMERRSSLQEEYLTTTNQIYETNKLMRQAQQEIDKTTNSVAKRKLANFISETEQMQEQSELSQYELDIQQAKYDLLLAEIALEEAQSAKSTVRLQRDSEGNFGYVYTADQSAVGEAEQNLADKQNALYNLGLEGANDYSQKYAETMQEAQDAITELTQMWMNGEIESEEEYQRRKAEIQDYYYEKLKQYSSLYQVALTTDSNVIKDAWSTDFSDMIYKTEDWKVATDDYFAGAAESMKTWAEVCGTVLEESGLDDVNKKVEEINTKSENLKNTLIGEDGESGVVGAMMSEVEAAGKLSEAYIGIQNQIDETIKKYEEMMGVINGEYTDENTPEVDPAIDPESEPEPEPEPPETPAAEGPTYQTGTLTWTGNGASRIWKDSTGKTYKYGSPEQKAIQKAFDRAYSANGGYKGDYWGGWNKLNADVLHKKYGLATGGYTGDWDGSYGKLAFLHQKELVLNANDTENFLQAMDILDKIVSAIDLYSMNSQLGGALSSPSLGNMSGGDILEQQVHIEASFPGVQDRNEIEEAFNTLINRASQYANRK